MLDRPRVLPRALVVVSEVTARTRHPCVAPDPRMSLMLALMTAQRVCLFDLSLSHTQRRVGVCV